MNVSRLVPLVAGLGAAAITILYVGIMLSQRDSGDAVSVGLITAAFASSAGAFMASLAERDPKRRLILLTWGATVALAWTLLLNTLTPLWLPVAVLGWIATIRSARSLNREAEGNRGWVIVGGTWAVCVALIALAVGGTIVSHESPSSGTGQGIAPPR